MVFNGSSTTLIYDDVSHVWHAADDDALKIEQVFGAAGGPGDNYTPDHEYWRVTTQDGTRYYFGIGQRYAGDAGQTYGASIGWFFGNNTGEPCHGATFAASVCAQAYRLDLDYVVDTRGNSMTYSYNKLTASVGLNNNTILHHYDLSATVATIDYGTRAGSEAASSAPMRVTFTPQHRCVNTCTQSADYPDTPWDLYCSSDTSCPNTTAEAFWTTFQLGSVSTAVWNPATSAYRTVDQWDMSYSFPATGDFIAPAGDDTSPSLWLGGITHTGYAPDGSALAEPAITFAGTRSPNRIDWGADIGVAPLMHYKLSDINNGVGGHTLVQLNGTDCTRAAAPGYDPAQNTRRCFQQYFTVNGVSGWGWFGKLTVAWVKLTDTTGFPVR